MAILRFFLKLLSVALVLFQVGCGLMTQSSPVSKIRPGKDFLPDQTVAIAAFTNQMAEKHGFDKLALEAVFREVNRSERALQLITPDPVSKPKNWEAYRERIIDSSRIKAGVNFWKKHRRELKKAEKEYGVPAEIIVGIIGVESFYGKTKGNFRVIDVLTTLSVEYPEHPRREARMAFFRHELEQALLFARDAELDPLSLNGSYAGAIGFPQFMPGCIRQFGVDYDQDEMVDLGESPKDAIGSVANYLKKHGWVGGEEIVVQARVESVTPEQLKHFLGQGLEAKFSIAELLQDGVQIEEDVSTEQKYGLIDLQNGENPTEYWLATENFFAITKYNRSYFYAMSVVALGNAVKQARAPRLVRYRRN
ncbi:MAG: lytic murein transglycosylase B [Oxalobacter sp.]|jgi:membrane-bound lytic murein transglycosylase B|nr:MAG: lytic murein transglycosylase B [Oxalobacter sp.]